MKNAALLSTASLVCLSLSSMAHADNTDIANVFKGGDFFGEVRYRYERVEQDGIANEANAKTARTNVGFKTGEYRSFRGLAEAQLVTNLGPEDYNSLDNGQTTFPTVADPAVTQINRAWVSYTGIPDTEVKVGRQAINLANQRFVGTVGWRQNDQTFDAATITNKSVDGLKLKYSYIANVNRIFAGSTPNDDLDSETHIVDTTYKVADWLKVGGYAYFMDFENAASSSNKTYGVRAKGKTKIADNAKVLYEAEFATQTEHGDNTANYDENYYHVAGGLSGHGLTVKAGYEVLGGDGTNAFQTPLATLHKFNGWADKFLSTPAAGLKDLYVSGSYKFSGTNTPLDGAKFTAIYHDFEGDQSGDFGNELNLALGKKFKLPKGLPFDNVNVLLKYADYDAEDTPYTDTEKFWFQFGVKF